MAKDERLYARFDIAMDEVAESEFPYYSHTYRPGMTYVVSWPANGSERVVKVGISDRPARWRMFTSRGATLHKLWRGDDRIRLESALYDRLASLGFPAFDGKPDAVPFVGSSGAGWMECWSLTRWAFEQFAEEVGFDAVVQGR